MSSSNTRLKQIKHIVVLMLENRSFDNMLGWLYDRHNAPAFNFMPLNFDGLSGKNLCNPLGSGEVCVGKGDVMTNPNPDPNEGYNYVYRRVTLTQPRPRTPPPPSITPRQPAALAAAAVAPDKRPLTKFQRDIVKRATHHLETRTGKKLDYRRVKTTEHANTALGEAGDALVRRR